MTEESLFEQPVVQRRAYVRVAITRPMRLDVPGDQPGGYTSYKGLLVDLSERAARCTIWADPATVQQLVEGCRVTINFTLRQCDFTLPGEVALSTTNTGDELTELIIQFDWPVGDAKALRRELFAEQIRQRHVAKLG